MKSNLRQVWLSSWFDPFHIGRRFIYKDIKQHRGFVSGVLLDIGCGDKPYLKLLQGKFTKYIGLDIPSRIPRSNIKEIQKVIDVYGSGFRLPFKNHRIDTILCIEVLQHAEEPGQIFSEISRVLKKDGILLLIAPQNVHIHEAPYDFYRYTGYGLEYLCRKNNLRILRSKRQGGFWAVMGFETSVYLFNTFCLKKDGKMRYLSSLIILPFGALIQLLFLSLDTINRNSITTINNFVMAKQI